MAAFFRLWSNLFFELFQILLVRVAQCFIEVFQHRGAARTIFHRRITVANSLRHLALAHISSDDLYLLTQILLYTVENLLKIGG